MDRNFKYDLKFILAIAKITIDITMKINMSKYRLSKAHVNINRKIVKNNLK